MVSRGGIGNIDQYTCPGGMEQTHKGVQGAFISLSRRGGWRHNKCMSRDVCVFIYCPGGGGGGGYYIGVQLNNGIAQWQCACRLSNSFLCIREARFHLGHYTSTTQPESSS